MLIDSSLYCKIMSSINAIFSCPLRVRAAGPTLQRINKSKMTWEFISSPFGYLRHLRAKLLVDTRKQTNKTRDIGSQNKKASCLETCCKIMSCSCAPESCSNELGQYLQRGLEIWKDHTLCLLCSIFGFVIVFFGGRKIKEKFQRPDSLLIWRAQSTHEQFILAVTHCPRKKGMWLFSVFCS